MRERIVEGRERIAEGRERIAEGRERVAEGRERVAGVRARGPGKRERIVDLDFGRADLRRAGGMVFSAAGDDFHAPPDNRVALAAAAPI